MHPTLEKRLGFLGRIQWEKLFIWTLFLLLVYVIRDFFALAFLTFILTYIFYHLSEWTLGRFFRTARPRWARVGVVTIYYLLLLGGVTFAAIALGPVVYKQADELVRKVREVEAGRRIAEGMGRFLADSVGPEKADLAHVQVDSMIVVPKERPEEARALLRHFLETHGLRPDALPPEVVVDRLCADLRRYHEMRGPRQAVAAFLTEVFKVKESTQGQIDIMLKEAQRYLEDNFPSLLGALQGFLGSLFQGMVHIFLAVIFSFLILLDLPRIAAKVESLAQGRLCRFYEEVKPVMVGLASVIGRAFQAQSVIALLNTAFTFVGMRIIGLPHAEVLSVIVFLCSFIPVAGVFISTVPMVLVALQMKGGSLTTALWVVLLVTIIHMLEAYVFNPRIMGEFLHMHPLFVLLILVVAEHFFHIWGLLLGVPVVYYLFAQVIRQEPARPGAGPGLP